VQPAQPVVALTANVYVAHGVRSVTLKVMIFDFVLIVMLVVVELTIKV
jgi:hypothetical protein